MKTVWLLVGVLLLSAPFAAVAHADPSPDPHIANPQARYCPGGMPAGQVSRTDLSACADEGLFSWL
jgi:hypothetical protein